MVGAAREQGAANREAAIASGQMSNANVSNPYGTQTVQWRPDQTTGNPVPYITQTYNPEQQQIFSNEQQLQKNLGYLGIKASDLAGQTIEKPLDFNERFGTQAQGRQGVIDAMMSRYDADAGRQKESINANLLARGIPVGSKAYEVEMDRLSRARNDALQTATISADSKAMEERRQAITEALAERQIPLNEISAFRTGSQISPLQFSGVSGAQVAPMPIFGGQQAQFNANADIQNFRAQQQAGMMGGLFGLGQAALMR